MKETKRYTGETGADGGFDGWAGLILGQEYTGELQDVPAEPQPEGEAAKPVGQRVYIKLPKDRTTSVTPDEWARWFTK